MNLLGITIPVAEGVMGAGLFFFMAENYSPGFDHGVNTKFESLPEVSNFSFPPGEPGQGFWAELSVPEGAFLCISILLDRDRKILKRG